MPGIVGIVGKDSAKGNASMLSQMVKAMLHEPFYRSSLFTNEELRLSIGWVGHGGSVSDCMPLWNEAKNICLMFSGEEFTDQAEVQCISGKGHDYGHKKSDYLVHMYEAMEDKFFERLNGRFSGILVDLRRREVVLFNDRYGLGRVYYHENANGFYFASEAKALLRILPELRRLDHVALGEWFSCGCPFKNRTLFSGVSLLPGGSAWSFSLHGGLKKESYFKTEVWENQIPLAEADYHTNLEETFARVLPRYYKAEDRVAVSLTGGVDSRMLMAWDTHAPGTLPCYTFGSMFRDCKDVTIARQVASICRQPYEVIKVGQEFLTQFPRLAEQTVYFSDGCMDVSGAPDLYANRIARQIAPVRLTGNYGGEVLRNIIAFKPMRLENELFEPGFQELIRDGRRTYFDEIGNRRLSFIAFKQVPWHHYSRLSLELSQLTVRSPYLDNDLVALAFRAPETLSTSTEAFLQMIADGCSELGKIGTDRSVVLGEKSIVDRLNNLFQEFTFRAEYAFDYGMPHWLTKMDNLVRPCHLERIVLGRHKFSHFRLWYRNDLSPYIKDILLDSRTMSRPYLNARNLESIVRSHTEGHGNYTLEIHRVLTTELIHRLLIESW